MRVSFLLAAWLADASSRTLQVARKHIREINRKALVQTDHSHAQHNRMGMFEVLSILTEGQMTSGYPAPSSCPA